MQLQQQAEIGLLKVNAIIDSGEHVYIILNLNCNTIALDKYILTTQWGAADKQQRDRAGIKKEKEEKWDATKK